jgi:flagellar protein FliS
MRTNPYEAYINDEILNADPLKLVQLMYQGTIDAVTSARASLARRDVKARSGSITKAILILTELSSSLNHEKGGELSARLAALYDYMQRRLLEANQKQEDAPLAEVAQLLQTLFEAWESIGTTAVTEAAAPQGALAEVALPAVRRRAYTEVEDEEYVPMSYSY